MKEKRKLFLGAASGFALALILITSMAVNAAHAQTFTVLYNFGGVPGDATSPFGPIAQGRDGNLYATTSQGGSQDFGTVFKITPAGTLTLLSSLGGDAGDYPEGLTLGRDGNFYGATNGGGNAAWGTIFKTTPEGALTVLHSFSYGVNGGYSPVAGPIQGADGNLYGTTAGGGAQDLGIIYKITSLHRLTTMYEFNYYYGHPGDPLLQATDGNFYGTTQDGSAFKITPAGVFTTLAIPPGIMNYAPFIQGNNGSFYGVTINGGRYSAGTVFQMSYAGKTRVLHNFNWEGDGNQPSAGLVLATDGYFYGTAPAGGAQGSGTIYRLSTTGDFSVIYSFDRSTGAESYTTLVQHTNGTLYGETQAGGTYGYGVFYSLDIGAPPFARLVTTFGKVGRTIGILGQGFTGATEVSFNGIPATFTVSSDTYLEATVPVGAVTGFVTVTTSTGTLTSNQQIQIRQ